MDAKAKEYIDYTIEQMIIRLRMEQIINSEQKTTTERMEELLRSWSELSKSDDPKAKLTVRHLEEAISQIRDDPYHGIVEMYYMDRMTWEEIAAEYGVDRSTVQRKKQSLVDKIRMIVMTEDYLKELFS